MDTLEAMRRRRTIRRFHPEPVPADALERILEAGRQAPSGANRQPWRFVVVEDDGAKAEIRRHCEEADRRWHDHAPAWLKAFFDAQEIRPVKEFLSSAPHLVCVFAQRGNPYWRESTWIAVGYMALQAAAEGLGTVTYTPGQTRYLNRILSMPDDLLPVCILPIGRPAEAPPASLRPRRPLAETVRRPDSFVSVPVGGTTADRPAGYGDPLGVNLPSLMDSREALTAVLELVAMGGRASDLPSLMREALPLLGHVGRLDAVRIDDGGETFRWPSAAAADGARIRIPLPEPGSSAQLHVARAGGELAGPDRELVEALASVLAASLDRVRLRNA